ncbi:MAG: FG-GAP-like repeat-containing protein, partial [Bacteroidota bacterium]
MKEIFTLIFILTAVIVAAQPVDETILTKNFTDPYDIKASDLDNNSFDDLIVCGVGGISWFSNTNGSDFEVVNIMDTAIVFDIEVLDFDGDSDIDIAGICRYSNRVFWLENNGSEHFTYHLITDTVLDLRHMYAGDMDNDGNTDFLISRYDGGYQEIHLLNNTGTGYTTEQVDRVDFGSDIYAFDYENDGDIDFLSKTNYSPFTTEELAIMVNDGTNTFSELQIYEKTGDIDVSHAQFTDIDNDGTGDLLIADHVQDELFWLEGTTIRHDIISSENVTEAVASDFNNDGVKDIAYKNDNSGDFFMSVLQGSNPGPSMNFTEVWSENLEVASEGIVPIDVDNNNLNEIAYSSAARDELGYFYNNDSFNFTMNKLATNVSQPESLRRVDLDQDGDMDIVAIGSGTELIWLEQKADGSYNQHIIISTLDNPQQIEVDDIDEDGDLDIITTSTGNDDFIILYNDGNLNFTEHQLTSLDSEVSNPAWFSIADLDNDGDKDFVIVGSSISSYNPKGIFWIRNDGGGNFSDPITIEDDLNMMGEVITHDFDDDGDIDIVVADGAYGSEGLMVLENHNSAQYFTISQPLSFKAETIRKGDVDGDGLMDFVCRNDDDNDIVWMKSNGDLTFTVNTIPMSESRDVEFELCDAGNDGDTDILFYGNYFGYTNSNDFNAGILVNDGDENFTQTYFLENTANMLSAVPVDVDLDGDMDFFLGVDISDKISFYENMAIDLIDPTISSWPTASDITYEDMLSNSTLSGGVASVPGTFSFTNPTYVPDAGTYTAQVTFTPDDPATYSTLFGTTTVNVLKATPVITTWPTASDISYGESLSVSVLSDGVASTSGSFTFDNPSTTPAIGTYTAAVTFTADETSNYNTVSGTVNVTVNQATPTVTDWPTASPIDYGQSLSASVISGGSASVTGSFSFDNPSTAPDAGTFSAAVTFTPDDIVNYTTVSGTVDVSVNQITPTVSDWPTASGIIYGETLSASVLSGGTSSVSGTFSFDAPATAPNAGSYTADVTFTPDDNTNYNTVSGSVSVLVSKADPVVSVWPTASDIDWGDPLSASVLSGGSADVAGNFSFDNPATTPEVGVWSAAVSFTPDDAANYNSISGNVDVNVNALDPSVSEWPTASAINYGESLSASLLSGGSASVSGTFNFDTPATTPDAGIYTANVTFTPDDDTHYNTVSGTVDVTVNMATPTVTDWPTASDITYGDALSASDLSDGSASVSGTFSFDSPATTPDAGIYTAGVTFTPDDALNYNTLSGTVDVSVNMADPTVTDWPTASDITYGDALSASVLGGGTTSVSGTFSFDVPTTTPDAGVYTADITFTPDDMLNYNTVSGTVDVSVNMATPSVTDWPTASEITYGEALSASVLSGGSASVAGTFSFDNPATTPNASLFNDYTADVTFTPDDAINYNPVSGTVDVTVNPATPTISDWPTASDITYGESLSASVLTGGTSSVSGSYSFDNPATSPNAGVYTAAVTFTPDDAFNYTLVSGTVDVNVNPGTPSVTEWPTASDITYGEALSASVLSGGTASVAGSFSFDNPATTPDAGVYTA